MRNTAFAFALVALLAAGPARAHDTWFQPLGDGGVLALGTGTRFPVQDFAIGAEQLVQHGCRDARGRAVPLVPLRTVRSALWLQPAPAAADCWAQLQPFEIELTPAIVAVYLDEIHASAAVRAAWADQQARGLPWRERFTKHARIVRSASGAAALPSALGLDLLMAGEGPAQPGDTLRFQLLRDGRPLGGQALELVDADGRCGGWRHTDADGRVVFTVPAPGRWLLRGTELRPVADRPGEWDSRFVTLAFEVAQNGNTLNSNSRSASHTAASAAISAEPPVNTTRR